MLNVKTQGGVKENFGPTYILNIQYGKNRFIEENLTNRRKVQKNV